MSSTTTVSFKWLDILEKEFDKAFVKLDMILGELDVDDTDVIYAAKKQLATLCSCFAQLSHKALTVFQINAKTEAELINLRSETVELKADNQLTRNRLHTVLLQWHSLQLDQLPYDSVPEEIAVDIKNRLQQDMEQHSSPVHNVEKDDDNAEKLVISLENWRKLLETENKSLRLTIAGLQSEVCAARLAARYLDKELVGRIQQLQLLSKNNMSVELKTKLWDQLDEEILLQRHKTVIKVMQQQKNRPIPPDNITGIVRTVRLYREPDKGLGISVTGGKEHDIPIIISDLEVSRENSNLYIGDAILSVNGINLVKLTHKEAVKVLIEQVGDVVLTVKSLPHSNESEEDQDAVYFGYPFFEDCEEDKINFKDDVTNTSTVTFPQIPVGHGRENVRDDLDNGEDKRNKTDVLPNNHNNSDSGISGVIPFGGTVLQKIFNAMSSPIERRNSEITSENNHPFVGQSASVGSEIMKKNSSKSSTVLLQRNTAAAVKSPSLPGKHNFQRIVKAETVAEIEDASRGTPV